MDDVGVVVVVFGVVGFVGEVCWDVGYLVW